MNETGVWNIKGSVNKMREKVAKAIKIVAK